MIRPSSLIRGDEPNTPRIEANANNINKESLDCGITAIRCCNSHSCQKLGTSKLFVTILVFVGIFQGIIERYFFITANQAADEFQFDQVLLEWLLVTSGVVQGIFALTIAYWANRVHRISWLGGLLILQSLLSVAVIIPILTNSTDENHAIAAYQINQLCTEHTIENLSQEKAYAITTLIMLFILQFGIGVGNIAYYTLGLSYMDDNVRDHHSPALIGLILAAKIWGAQWGSAIYYGVAATPFGWWLGWTIIGPILFILAFLICLFPKRLLGAVVRQAADNIIETATNSSQISLSANKLLADISFFSTLKRMFLNPILMLNIMAAVFIETAIYNFFHHEDSYLQARFLLPADPVNRLDEEWLSRLLTRLLKPTIVAMSIILAGLIIAKAMPSARKLAAWNVATAAIVAGLFVAYIFLSCDNSQVAGAYNGKLTKPFCSRSCVCDNNIRFSPVCPDGAAQTFYSPCHAGCSDQTIVNNVRVFTNCTCGIDSELSLIDSQGIATDGACGYLECQIVWIIFQILTILGATLLGSGMVANVLITIRSVLPQDKAMALSMELFLLGIIVYIPGKLGYQAIADFTCQFWSQDHTQCYIHESPLFGNLINIVTAALIAIGVIFEIIVLILVKDLIIYEDEQHGNYYRPIANQQQQQNPQNYQSDNEDIPMQPLLLRHQQQQQQQQQDQQHSNHPTNPTVPNDRFLQSPTQNVIRFELPQQTSTSLVSQQMLQQAATSSSPQPPSNSGAYSPDNSRIQRNPIAEELDLQLQNFDENAEGAVGGVIDTTSNVLPSKFRRSMFGSDINPSVGDISDRESDLDIRQLENSISPLSRNGSSLSPPSSTEVTRTKPPNGNVVMVHNRRPISPETDF